MEIFNNHIDLDTYLLVKDLIRKYENYYSLNSYIEKKYNIIDFANNQEDFILLKTELLSEKSFVLFDNIVEYGDFQTPETLTARICSNIRKNGIITDTIVEPTSGTGNFIISAMKSFDKIDSIYGIEINRNYSLLSKLKIISLIESVKFNSKPKVKIFNDNIFDFNFDKLNLNEKNKILVLGNPPWVTNTILSTINSTNLPPKSNFKNHSGIEAITGKGNFDISEYITLMIINYFQNKNAYLSFIIKNSVVKNILFDQFKNNYKISNIKKLNIDAQKEFNVSVDASVFQCEFNKDVAYNIEETSLYNSSKSYHFGWHNKNFVSNIDKYKDYEKFDGKSPYVWRSGIKHDCAKVLELEKSDGKYKNALGEKIALENDLIYSYLKGSALKNKIINNSQTSTIITQKNVSGSTEFIEKLYPKTYKYLYEHESYFENRKSSIYHNKPKFSIFGIGDYSFKPYKIAIAALYKNYNVSLILPDKEKKPIMLDDTCYFLSFDKLDYALIVFSILNHTTTVNFIDSITFNDIKRKYTKDVLMRIDLFKLSQYLSYKEILKQLESIAPEYLNIINENTWIEFIDSIKDKKQSLVFY